MFHDVAVADGEKVEDVIVAFVSGHPQGGNADDEVEIEEELFHECVHTAGCGVGVGVGVTYAVNVSVPAYTSTVETMVSEIVCVTVCGGAVYVGSELPSTLTTEIAAA